MYYYLIGLVTGIVIGFLVNKLLNHFKKGIDIQIIGFNISIRAIEKAPVVPIDKPKEKKQVKLNLDGCELCKGEDMYIAGTKNLIPCPKCKRNAGKFKELLTNC